MALRCSSLNYLSRQDFVSRVNSSRSKNTKQPNLSGRTCCITCPMLLRPVARLGMCSFGDLHKAAVHLRHWLVDFFCVQTAYKVKVKDNDSAVWRSLMIVSNHLCLATALGGRDESFTTPPFHMDCRVEAYTVTGRDGIWTTDMSCMWHFSSIHLAM